MGKEIVCALSDAGRSDEADAEILVPVQMQVAIFLARRSRLRLHTTPQLESLRA